MCGVIGYVGWRDATARLLSGLERLEYRGYDSAGICLLRPNGLELTKAVGKLENLKAVSARRGMPFEWSFLLDALQTERDQCITIDTTQISFRTRSRDGPPSKL